MSEFPFPPERLWTQYEEGPEAGPAPPKPVEGDFMIFGAALQTTTPQGLLEASNTPRHFEGEPQGAALGQQLTKLNAKMMGTFLELLDEILTNPEVGGLDPGGKPLEAWVPLAAEKSLETLKQLFLNFHHLLNSNRPAQAREELLRLLEEQRVRRHDANSQLQSERNRLEQMLADSIRKIKATGLRDIEKLCASASATVAGSSAAVLATSGGAQEGSRGEKRKTTSSTAEEKADGSAAAPHKAGEAKETTASTVVEADPTTVTGAGLDRMLQSPEEAERLRKLLRR
jgi:mediator of RNA polymerase II transcription subunit 7